MIRKKILSAMAVTFILAASSTAQATDEIKIGLLTTLSGPVAALGTDIRDGFILGIKHSDGKLGGLDVKLLIADDQLNPETGRQSAERFIRQEKVDVMTGVAGSNVLLPILPMVLRSNTIYLSPNTGPAEYAGAKCNKNFFAVAWQNEDIPQAMGRYAMSQNYHRIALITSNYPGGRETINGFKTQYKGKIVEEIYTKLGQVDFASELSTIRAAKPDAIFFFLSGGMGVNFIKQFEASGMKGHVALLTPGYSADVDTINAVGDVMVGIRNASQWAIDLDNKANKRFVRDFTQTYGRAPTMYASQGYDVARLLDSAVRAVNGNIKDKAALSAAIHKANFQSVRGKFRFNNNNYPIQNIYIREVVKDEKGHLASKLAGTILEDHADRFASECPMS